MPTRHLPSLEALVADDDERMTAELSLLEAREQVARARRLLEHAERLVPPEGAAVAEGAGEGAARVAAELARLGYRMVAIASALRRVQQVDPV